jgi:hypothetical protein
MSFVPVSITHHPILPSERQIVRAVSVSSFGRLVAQRAASIRACVAVKDGPWRVPSGRRKNHARDCIAAPPGETTRLYNQFWHAERGGRRSEDKR